MSFWSWLASLQQKAATPAPAAPVAPPRFTLPADLVEELVGRPPIPAPPLPSPKPIGPIPAPQPLPPVQDALAAVPPPPPAASKSKVPAICAEVSEFYEGFKAAPYLPTKSENDRWTIGIGSTRDLNGNPVTPNTKSVTHAQAVDMALRDLNDALAIVNRNVLVSLTEGQLAALVLFVNNLGPGAKGVKDGFVTLKSGGQSTMLKRLNQRDYAGAATQFPLWANAGSQGSLLGLRRRRAAEQALFLGKDWMAAHKAAK